MFPAQNAPLTLTLTPWPLSDRFSVVHEHQMAQLEFELSQQHEKFKKSTPYQIFDLWEGCGKKHVQTRYYELVKTHHPDRYGGNTSSKLKKLTQAIFLQVQDAYQTLSLAEDGPQTAEPPEQLRAERLSQITRPRGRTPSGQGESIQYKRMRRTGEFESNAKSDVFEAVTISERDASTLEEDSLPEEERRAKLAKLARTARSKTVRPPITQILAHHGSPSLEEDSALSINERREKLAQLSSRTKAAPFQHVERTPTTPGLQTDSVPMADIASSGTIRGLSSAIARQQAQVPRHKQDFTTGVKEMRESRYKHAYDLIKAAYETEPTNNLYKTYYAYLSFVLDANQKTQAETTLKDIIKAKDRLALPDAYLFLGHVVKAGGHDKDKQRAHQYFQKALELNPSNHEAEREVRLYEMRHKQESNVSLAQTDVGSFFKRLFKK